MPDTISGDHELEITPADSSCCHECADLVTICTVASPRGRTLRAEDGRASYIGIRKATYRAEGALYLCVHHRERGCLETGCPRTQRLREPSEAGLRAVSLASSSI